MLNRVNVSLNTVTSLYLYSLNNAILCHLYNTNKEIVFSAVFLNITWTRADNWSVSFLHVLQTDSEDQTASDLAVVLFETATLRSGYQLVDTKAYGDRIERMLRLSMNVPLDEQASRYQLPRTHLHGKVFTVHVSSFLFHCQSVSVCVFFPFL